MKVDVSSLYRRIGKTLRNQRIALGMTQQQLADASGQLRTSIANIEAGRQRAPLHVLYLVCAVLNLDLRELLPPMAEVVLDEDLVSADPVQIPGLEQKIPPLSAALLRQLLRDDEEKA